MNPEKKQNDKRIARIQSFKKKAVAIKESNSLIDAAFIVIDAMIERKKTDINKNYQYIDRISIRAAIILAGEILERPRSP